MTTVLDALNNAKLNFDTLSKMGLKENPIAMLNSGNGDDNFIITIKDQSAIDAAKPK